MKSLGVIGECMLEFRQAGDAYHLGYGGDVFNTAVYATRLGLDVSFFTAIGDDHYSNYLIEAWADEGVATDTVRVVIGEQPSLYIIETDEIGERTFHYWRDTSPFKRWLNKGEYLGLLPGMLMQHQCIYFSGISFALLSESDREILLETLSEYRQAGGLIGFDPNYRPRLWRCVEEANEWADRAYAISDFAFPSYDDESLMRDETSHDKLIEHIRTLGVPEVIIKDGTSGATVVTQDRRVSLASEAVTHVIDTTAAGDSFNGAYLSSRLKGKTPEASAKLGCKVAAKVIQHRGAVIPRTVNLKE